MRIICPDCKGEWPLADFTAGGACPHCHLSYEDLAAAAGYDPRDPKSPAYHDRMVGDR